MTSDQNDKERVEQLFDNAIQAASDLQQTYAEAARLAGYTRDSLIQAKPYWSTFAGAASTDPSSYPILASGEYFLNSFYQELRRIGQQNPAPLDHIRSAAGTATTLTYTTSIFADSPNTAEAMARVMYTDTPFRIAEGKATLTERLTKIDPDLGQTFQQVWDSLYGTTAEPERGALYQMRQTFDHFFQVLAPDEEVRQSNFWTPKEGDNRDQIHRKERIEFAAHQHVKDVLRATTLAASAEQMVDIYQSLNQAHKRGKLQPAKARQALSAMGKILEDWLDALGL